MLFRIFISFLFFNFSLFALESIKIGVLAKRSADITLKKYSATADYLSDKLDGYEFKIIPLTFEELRDSVETKKIDFVLTNTAYYVELEHLYGISRIATLKNLGNDGKGLSSFGGVICTKKDSGIKTLQDLKGKRFGAVNIDSFGGWIMAQKELNSHGIEINDFLEFKFYGSHDAVILALKNGEIDVGTVRTDTIERMSNEGKINRNFCYILSKKRYKDFPFEVSTALYPEWPFSKLSATPQSLANDVLIALLEMPSSSKPAKDAHILGWTIPLDYSSVHNLLKEMNLSFYGEIKKFTFAQLYEKYKIWFYLILAIFIIIISVLLYIYQLNKVLKDNKIEIQELNSGLEIKIKERTLELEKMYDHERYLKDILKTIADVNKILVKSFSTQTIIQNSMDRLAKHNDYKFVWIGLIKENLLEIVSQSRDNKIVLDQKHYKLEEHQNNFALKSAKNSIELNTTVIEKLSKKYQMQISMDTYDCSSCWMIVLPLRSSEDKEPLGTISVFSQREDGFEPEEVKMLENLATDIGFALHSVSQKTMLESMELEKISNYEETILAFVNIIEQRDSYTAGHTVRVAEYCRLLASEMGLAENDINKLEKAAILHDIGKVVTPDAILLKPGKLTSLEYELIKQHSYAGYQMLSKIDMYKDLAEIIRYHHIRYDGNGYPLTSKEAPYLISILSHIMVVADAFDAMTSTRIYKPRKSVKEAVAEIKKFSGTQFHPDVAKAAVNVLKDVEISETTQLPSNELEQRRFAYFFRDSLTDVYNENYLKVILIKKEDDSRCFNIIELNHFSRYNNKYGWDAGSKLLKQFSQCLENLYPNAKIFRYHGDDFILIFEHHVVINQKDILSMKVLENSGILLKMNHYDLKDGIPIF